MPRERVLDLSHDPGVLADRPLVMPVDFVDGDVHPCRGLAGLMRTVEVVVLRPGTAIINVLCPNPAMP